MGHVGDGQDGGDDALVAVSAGHFVADLQLAALGDGDAHLHFHAGGQAAAGGVALVDDGDAGEVFDVAQEVVHFALEDAAQVDGEGLFVGGFGTQGVLGGGVQFGGAGAHEFVEPRAVAAGALGQDDLQPLDQLVGGDPVDQADAAGAVFLGGAQGFDLVQVAGFGVAQVLLHGGVAGEDADVDHGAFDAVRDAQGGVFHLAGFFAEDGAEQLLLGGQLGFALGGDFADEDVAGADLCADLDHAVGVEVEQGFFGDVGDVAGDFLVAELGFARADVVLGHVDGGEFVVLDEPLGDDHGVFEVVALPGHEGGEHVLAEGELAVVGRGGVGDRLACDDAVAAGDDRALVDAGALVGAEEFDQRVAGLASAAVVADADLLGGDAGDFAVGFGEQHLSGVVGGVALHAGADEGHFGAHQGDGLALHVRAHQGAVGVVVLEEGDQAGGDGDDLAGRDVHVADFVGVHLVEVVADAGFDALADEAAVGVERRVGLGDHFFALVVGGQFFDFVGDEGADRDGGVVGGGDLPGEFGRDGLAGGGERRAVAVFEVVGEFAADQAGVIGRELVDHLAVGGFDEAVFVEHAEGGEAADQADVGAFGGFDGADSAVVAVVDVAHVEAGAVAAESAGSERGEAALVGEFGERVGLVHELAELVSAEEFADGGLDGADVDQCAGGGLVGVDDGHPLAHDALHAHHADAELVLQLLADGADAAVAEVVDVVGQRAAVVDRDLGVDDGEEVAHPEGAVAGLVGGGALGVESEALGALGQLGVEFAEPLADLVAADAAQVVAAGVEELSVEQAAGGLGGGRVAGAQALVELVHGPLAVALGAVAGARFLVDRGGDELVDFLFGVGAFEHRHDALVGAQAGVDFGSAAPARAAAGQFAEFGVVERAQQGGDGDFALAVDLDGELVAVAGFEFEPGAAAGDQFGGAEGAAGGGVGVGAEVDAGRADQLGDDDALGAVDDEGAGLGHVGQVAEEQLLLFGFVGFLAEQADGDAQFAGVVEVALAALVRGLVGRDVAVVLEVELHAVAGEVGDRGHFAEEFAQALIEEPLVGVAQQVDQVGQLVRFGQARVVDRGRRGENHGVLLQTGRPSGRRGTIDDARARRGAASAALGADAVNGGMRFGGSDRANPRRSLRGVGGTRGAEFVRRSGAVCGHGWSS